MHYTQKQNLRVNSVRYSGEMNFIGDCVLHSPRFVDYHSSARIITLEEVDSVCTYRLISFTMLVIWDGVLSVPAVTKERVPAESTGFLLFAVSPVRRNAWGWVIAYLLDWKGEMGRKSSPGPNLYNARALLPKRLVSHTTLHNTFYKSKACSVFAVFSRYVSIYLGCSPYE